MEAKDPEDIKFIAGLVEMLLKDCLLGIKPDIEYLDLEIDGDTGIAY